MPRTDDNLPGLGQRTLVPRLAGGAALLQKNLTQSEGYVLSRIDGRTTLWEICLLVPLRRDDTLRILRRLRADGVIEVPGSLEPIPVADRSPPAAPAPAASAPPAQRTAPPAQRTAPPAQRTAPAELALLLDDEPSAATPARPPPQPSPVRPAPTPPATQPAAAQRTTPAPELTLQLEDAPAAQARPAPAPEPAPPTLALELESSAPPPDPRPRAQRPHAGSGPTPVPSLRSFVSAQSVFAAQPAAEGRSRASASRTSASRPVSRSAPETSEPGASQPGEPLPEVEVIRRSSRAPGLIDDLRPHRRTDPPRAPAQPPGQAQARPARATAPVEETCDLSPEQRRRVDEVHAQLHVADAFTLLGVSPQDDRKAVQRAYFKLSKEFHPDRFFNKKLGSYAPRVAAVFQGITEARDILVDEERRNRYLLGDTT